MLTTILVISLPRRRYAKQRKREKGVWFLGCLWLYTCACGMRAWVQFDFVFPYKMTVFADKREAAKTLIDNDGCVTRLA